MIRYVIQTRHYRANITSVLNTITFQYYNQGPIVTLLVFHFRTGLLVGFEMSDCALFPVTTRSMRSRRLNTTWRSYDLIVFRNRMSQHRHIAANPARDVSTFSDLQTTAEPVVLQLDHQEAWMGAHARNFHKVLSFCRAFLKAYIKSATRNSPCILNSLYHRNILSTRLQNSIINTQNEVYYYFGYCRVSI